MVKSVRYMFAQSVQGASHIKKEEAVENKELGQKFPCQDKSGSRSFPADKTHKTPYYLTVACDGHGGAPYFRSARGAELAIASIEKILPTRIDEIARLLKDVPHDDYSGLVPESCDRVNIDDAAVSKNILSLLVPPLLTEWKRTVDSDRTENPITEEELTFLAQEDKQAADHYRDALAAGYCDKANEILRPIYGTTFLCFVAAEHFWFAVQIGDGDIAVHGKDGFSTPVPEDERNFLNQTTSLCDKDAEHEFRIAFGTCKIDAVFCATDGLANSFANKDQLFTFYQKILSLFRTYNFGAKQAMRFFDWKTEAKKRIALAEDEIKSSLPDISKLGSGDDITLAGFVDISEGDIKNALKAAKLVEEGKKVQKIPLKAENKFREAADLGSPEGCYLFGYMIREKSRLTAIKYLAKAIEGGIKEAKEPIAPLLFEEAQALQQTGKHADAFKYFLKSAEYGMKEAQYEVSLYFGRPQDYEHCGVRQNFAEAIRWTFAAAKQGHPEAECKLGKCYRDGRGIQQDEELSLEWYKKAGEHGSLEAQDYLRQREMKEDEV
ncbi:protein phosphatase 2C domain-containing protein [Treponema sp. OMZ 787]|uniref:protein phosphatase 2C domain-containing protein n=1 Tax=Treponema sp. OMZ 787 TaxID=2563669 RepID=UPI0020A3F573|nr:protein phosphatase 2C domain-containing protein [Treponema sp. OMZ 787]UTC63032.1 protein phosphatase 2C domain-containing protein [Treponema sp. OMZ 787]